MTTQNNKVSVQQTRELAQREQHLKRAVRQDRELMEKSYGSASEFGRYLLTATVTDSDGNSHGDTITHLAERIEHRFNNLHGLHAAFPASRLLMYAAEGCFDENPNFNPASKRPESTMRSAVSPLALHRDDHARR